MDGLKIASKLTYQQLGNEVERQGKANKSYQLRYQGNSADRGSNLQHKANLKPLYYGAVYSYSVYRSRPG